LTSHRAALLGPLITAVVYAAVSLTIEATAMVVGGLKVPRDNRILIPIVLTVPPLVAAWTVGNRALAPLLVAAGTLSALTLVLTIAAGRVTGTSTGLAEPIIIRAIAGGLAGVVINRRFTRDW